MLSKSGSKTTMARHGRDVEAAAEAASQAARVLQARQQATKAEQPEKQSEPETQETPGERRTVVARNPARQSAMDEIRAARGEPEVQKEEPKEEEPKSESPPKVEDPKPEQIEAKTDQETPVEKPQEPVTTQVEMIRVKVDGEEFDVPKAEVDEYGSVAAYQRNRAAENRLKKANESLAETRRIAAWIAEQQAKMAQPVVQQKSPELRKQELMDTIRFGSPEESARAMDEYQGLTNPRTDPNQIVQAAVSEGQRLQAIDRFTKEFQDLNANPILAKAVVAIVNERLPEFKKSNTFHDWDTFYRSVGNEVRSAFQRPYQSQEVKSAATTAATPTDPTSQVSDKEARKASIVNLPTAAARATVPEESKPETREEAFNRIKKKRGLQTG